jgi:hypothetical protein
VTCSRQRRADHVGFGEDAKTHLALLGVHCSTGLLRLVLLAIEELRKLEDASLDLPQVEIELPSVMVVVDDGVHLHLLQVSVVTERVDLAAHLLHPRLSIVIRPGGRLAAAHRPFDKLVDENVLDSDVDRRVGTDTDDLGDVGRAVDEANTVFEALRNLVDGSVTRRAEEDLGNRRDAVGVRLLASNDGNSDAGTRVDESTDETDDRARLSGTGRTAR